MAEKKKASVEKKTSEKKIAAEARHYDVLRAPIISEKAARLSEANGLAFEVAPSATKKSIASAIAAIYGIMPKKVNIVNAKGSLRRFRNKSSGITKAIKKAYVKMPEGQTIDILAEAGKGK